MNTEQQLRERAETILNSHEIIFNGSIQKMKVTQAMLDFHNQELSRIGEVYVPTDKTTDRSEYELIYKGSIVGRLKKLSISEIVAEK